MTPRTKAQKEVEALSAKLRPLNKKDIQWAERKVPYFQGYEYNGNVICMHCGNKFAYKGHDKQRCPHCHRELNIKQSLARSYSDTECFVLADSVGDWQVLRYFHVVTHCNKRGSEAHTNIHEVMQRWIDSKCRYVVRTVAHSGIYAYQWRWIYGSPFEVRNVPQTYAYNRWDDESYCELRIRKMSPRLKYVPFSFEIFGSFFNYCKVIASKPYAETLYKQGKYKLLKRCIDYRLFDNEEIISAIKVALRHGYDIEADMQSWFDYVNTLRALHEDTRNPTIICPQDLNAAEQKYLRILRKKEADAQRQRDLNERLQRLESDKKLNETYRKKFGKLFGVIIAQGDIAIHVLKDVNEFMQEGDTLHHCVYDMEYYDTERHPYSLILDASVNGKRTETIEVDTRDFHIVQARGVCNMDSDYHKEIVELVNNNMEQFKQIAI